MSDIKKIWIDTDAGIDDSFAIISAFKLPNIEVVGFSAVDGNVECYKTFKNTRDVVSLCGKEDIKVYKGADEPLNIPHKHSYFFHGENGLGGVTIDESKAPVEKESAVDALYKKAKELNGELYVVAVGPLTNIAVTMFKYPDFVKYVKEIDIMGGSIGVGGNASVAAEFNIYTDPHAAQTVFKSGVPIVMFGLDVTLKALLNRDEIESLKTYKTKIADFLYDISATPMNAFRSFGLGDYMCLHDACPIVYLSDPTLFKGQKAGVYVETQSNISLGRTVSDLYIRSDDAFKNKNVTVMLEVDRDRFAKTVLDSYSKY